MTIPTDLPDRLARASLLYAKVGWPVLPLKPGSKEPATAHGFHDATVEQALIAAWWRACPQFNVGIATGAPGPDVLDIDVKADGDGYAALARLVAAGLLGGLIMVAATRNGGRHLYYPGTDEGCHTLRGHRVDLKARGGYIVAPPSAVPADDFALALGRPVGKYRLLSHGLPASRRPLQWKKIIGLLDPPRPQPHRARRTPVTGDPARVLAGLARKVSSAPDGERNRILFWAACRAAEHVAAGRFDPTAAHTALAEAAGQAGLGAIEITRTLRSAMEALR